LIILIAFVTWKMPKGVAFPEIKPLKPLATCFSTLWYTNDMTKQWQINAMFHGYCQHLKVTIESFPHMTLRTLHRYRSIEKFHVDPHFIYITMRNDEHQEKL
jgi:hypothetical protein